MTRPLPRDAQGNIIKRPPSKRPPLTEPVQVSMGAAAAPGGALNGDGPDLTDLDPASPLAGSREVPPGPAGTAPSSSVPPTGVRSRRRWKLFGGPRLEDGPPPGPERRPVRPARVRGKRESIAEAASGVWGTVGEAMVWSGRDVPTGRILIYQAPVAGTILDDAIRDTIVDRLVQPFATAGKKTQAIGSLVLPPLLIHAITKNPALLPPLTPLLRSTLATMIVEMGPALKAQREREKKMAETVKELMPELADAKDEHGNPVSPVDLLLASIFAGVDMTVAEPPAERPADVNDNGASAAA